MPKLTAQMQKRRDVAVSLWLEELPSPKRKAWRHLINAAPAFVSLCFALWVARRRMGFRPPFHFIVLGFFAVTWLKFRYAISSKR